MSENPNPLYADFTQTLDDCRQTYGTAATEYTREAHAANRRSPTEVAEWMDELHRGLLIKVYLEVAIADHQWSREEQKLAQILIEHLWGRRLTGTALRDAIKGLRDRSRQLSLRSTVSPFLEKSCLRHHLSELSTIIMRLANLVAKSDGDLRPSESHALHKMQETFDRMLAETESTLGLSQEETTPGIAVSVTSDPSSGPTNSPTPIEPQPTRSLDESLETLDALIGLDRVKAEDLLFDNVTKEVWQRFPPHTTQLQTCCSGCERVMTLKAQYLGRSMKCPRCDAVFPVKWGDLVEPEQTTTE